MVWGWSWAVLFNLYAAFTQYLIFITILQLFCLPFKIFEVLHRKKKCLKKLILIHWCFYWFCWLNKNQDTLLVKSEEELLQHGRMKKCIQLRPWKVDKARFQSLPVMSWLSKPVRLSEPHCLHLCQEITMPTFQVWTKVTNKHWHSGSPVNMGPLPPLAV